MQDDDWRQFTIDVKKLKKKDRVQGIKIPCFNFKPRSKTSEININDASTLSPRINKFDRKLMKNFAIDATLDLHGQTQQQALVDLKKFIENCFAKKYYNLLVITGKGNNALNLNTGVIKRQLPVWLNSKAFNQYIGAFSMAHSKHGGEGAYYIRLKKPPLMS